jgi:predicted LPLAT superfamily acyltransferase
MFVLIKPLHYKTLVKKITIDKSLDEDAAIRKALGEYVSFLEYNLNLYPDQWFNFYDFWSSDGISFR